MLTEQGCLQGVLNARKSLRGERSLSFHSSRTKDCFRNWENWFFKKYSPRHIEALVTCWDSMAEQIQLCTQTNTHTHTHTHTSRLPYASGACAPRHNKQCNSQQNLEQTGQIWAHQWKLEQILRLLIVVEFCFRSSFTRKGEKKPLFVRHFVCNYCWVSNVRHVIAESAIFIKRTCVAPQVSWSFLQLLVGNNKSCSLARCAAKNLNVLLHLAKPPSCC